MDKRHPHSKEPDILKQGKIFQRIVQLDYQKNSIGGVANIEENVSFDYLANDKKRKGRMDIIIHDDSNNSVTIIEIKSTNWDKIKSKNIKKNLCRHSRQLFNYIDKFITVDNRTVGLAIIYPAPPKSKEFQEFIETCALEEYSIPVYWYTEVMTK